MSITTDKTEYCKLWLETPFDAMCLKEHPDHGDWAGKSMPERMTGRKYGRIHQPQLTVGCSHSQDQFRGLVSKHAGEVVVIGHRDDPFIWRGTPQEFVEFWMVD